MEPTLIPTILVTPATPPSAQEHVWDVFELVGRIFEHLASQVATLDDYEALKFQTEDRRICRKTLLAAALSCRRFTEPALDVLWRTMDSLVPLITLLPVVVDPNFKSGLAWVQLQRCTPEIWATYNVYASRVKTFIYGANVLQQGRGISVHFSAFSALIMLQGTLLPRLTTLLVPTFSPESLALYFASSSLQRVEVGPISTTSAMHALEVFWMTIKSRVGEESSSLRHLSFGSAVPLGVLEAVLSPHVLSVKMAHPFPESLKVLASLTNLQRLEITKVPRNTKKIKFLAPKLKQVSLQGSVSAIASVLKACGGGRLHQIVVILELGALSEAFQQDEFKRLTLFVADKWRHSLRHFSIDYGASSKSLSGLSESTSERAATRGPNFMDYFQPFFGMKLLSFHVLNSSSRLSASTPLLDIALKFPTIQSLQLPPYHRGQEPSFTQLRVVAQVCPWLRSLGTSVNVQVAPTYTPILHHELDMLNVYESPISQTREVAIQLDRIFPYLRCVICEETPGLSYSKKWAEVERLLEYFHQGRRRDL